MLTKVNCFQYGRFVVRPGRRRCGMGRRQPGEAVSRNWGVGPRLSTHIIVVLKGTVGPSTPGPSTKMGVKRPVVVPTPYCQDLSVPPGLDLAIGRCDCVVDTKIGGLPRWKRSTSNSVCPPSLWRCRYCVSGFVAGRSRGS